MKINVFLLVVFIQGVSCCSSGRTTVSSNKNENILISKCSINPDTLYDHRKVIEMFASVLSASVPQYKEVFPKGFYVNDNEKCVGFSVYDLTDTLNKESSFSECVGLYNYHVYHFFPSIITYSYSYIAVLANGNVRIFKSVNCKGDKLEDIIVYLNRLLDNNPQKEGVINRVRNYRKYGDYVRIDEQSDFICK